MADWIEITDSDFSEKLKDVPVAIVDYYASWCGACRMAAPMFKRVGSELNLPIYKVDAEKNPTVRALVQVTNLPTIAIWKNGKMLASLSTTKEEGLKDFLKEHGVS